jgi:hypothetical protein
MNLERSTWGLKRERNISGLKVVELVLIDGIIKRGESSW